MKNPLTRICLSIFLCVSIAFSNMLFAQTRPTGEQIEPILKSWKVSQRKLKDQLGLSTADFNTFTAFYSSTLDSDQYRYRQLAWQGILKMADVNVYLTKLQLGNTYFGGN